MTFRNVLSLYLILAFMWSEEALSFSSPAMTSPPATMASTKYSNAMRTRQSLLPSSKNQMGVVAMPSHQPPQFQSTKLAMSTDDSSSEKEVTKEQEDDGEAANSQNNNKILGLPLLVKFIVVLMIKFLTDLIVFPTLFVWRLAKKTKRTIVGWFDKISFGTSAKTFKPNGSGK